MHDHDQTRHVGTGKPRFGVNRGGTRVGCRAPAAPAYTHRAAALEVGQQRAEVAAERVALRAGVPHGVADVALPLLAPPVLLAVARRVGNVEHQPHLRGAAGGASALHLHCAHHHCACGWWLRTPGGAGHVKGSVQARCV